MQAEKTTREAWDSHGSTGRAIEEISEGRGLDATSDAASVRFWRGSSTEKGLNIHSTKKLDLKRVSRCVRSLENTYYTGIVLLSEPERGSHFV